MRATEHVVPAAPVFPPMNELARIASSHDLTLIEPPLTTEDSEKILVSHR